MPAENIFPNSGQHSSGESSADHADEGEHLISPASRSPSDVDTFVKEEAKTDEFSANEPHVSVLNHTESFSKKPPIARKFSITSGKHEYAVTTYSSDKISPKSSKRRQTFTQGTFHDTLRVPLVRYKDKLHEEPVVIDIDEPDVNLPKNQSETSLISAIVGEHTRNLSINSDRSVSICRSLKKVSTKTDLDIARRGRAYANRKKDRLVDKNGDCRIVYSNVRKRGTRFLIDFFTTALEIKWRYHFLMFILVFGLSWVLFGLVWWGVTASNGYLHYGDNRENKTLDEGYVPCVEGVTDFASALLFSIETQHTIGYGTRAITPLCPLAVGILMFQSIYGVLIQCVLTGIIFAKLARPMRRGQTILFSKKAVICQRDGDRYLMFRVGDMRKSQILGANIQVLLADKRTTNEGEYLPIITRELNVTTETGGSFFFLGWPITVVHKIDSDSPLWEVSIDDLIEQEWELIAILEGTDEITGASFQVRTSFLPSEVLWGQQLMSLLNKRNGGVHEIDYTCFHETVSMDMKEMSARRASQFP